MSSRLINTSNIEIKENVLAAKSETSSYIVSSRNLLKRITNLMTRSTGRHSRSRSSSTDKRAQQPTKQKEPRKRVRQFLEMEPTEKKKADTSCQPRTKPELLVSNALTQSKSTEEEERTVNTRERTQTQSRESVGVSVDEDLKRQYGLVDFVIVLDDILTSEAVQRTWTINLADGNGDHRNMRTVLISEGDSGQRPVFAIDESGLGGTIVRVDHGNLEVEPVEQWPRKRSFSSPIVDSTHPETLEAVSAGKRRQRRRKKFHFQPPKKKSRRSNSAAVPPNADDSSTSLSGSPSQSEENNAVGRKPGQEQTPTSMSHSNVETSDEEQEPDLSVGLDQKGYYEVERILARRRSDSGLWLYYIKWAGWPYRRSTWQLKSSFGNMTEETKEFLAREKAIASVSHREQRWLKPKKLSQLHSLIRWENEINTVLRANGMQDLYIYNEIDYTRRKRGFTYIVKNKLSASVEAYVNSLKHTPITCNCDTGECGDGENCCPAMEKTEFFYTKRRGIRKRYYELAKGNIVECYGCRCSKDCKTKVVQNGRRLKVGIVRTKRCGWGVFAFEDIPLNTFVVEYVGEVLTVAEGDARSDRTYQFELDGFGEVKHILDAKYYGNEAAFINHSCDPNLLAFCVRVERFDRSIHRIALFSKRNISRGEELTLNYFEGRSNPEKILTPDDGTKECFCGASNCMRYWPRCDTRNFGTDGNKENKEKKLSGPGDA